MGFLTVESAECQALSGSGCGPVHYVAESQLDEMNFLFVLVDAVCEENSPVLEVDRVQTLPLWVWCGGAWRMGTLE